MGASRIVVIRQLLCEQALLGLVGGVLGAIVSWWAVDRLTALVARATAFDWRTAWFTFQVDNRVLTFALATSILTALIAGLFPALHGSRDGLVHALNEASNPGTGRVGRHRFRGALVICEVALSTILLVGAGLMIRNLLELSAVNPGFSEENALTVGMDLLSDADDPTEARIQAFEAFQARLKEVPGIRSVGAAGYLPLKASWGMRFVADGQPVTEAGQIRNVLCNNVNRDYFAAMGIPLLRGNTLPPSFSPGDVPIVVSRRLWQDVWPGEDPIGKRLTRYVRMGKPWFEVVGVVDDVQQVGVDQQAEATVYFPYQFSPLRRMTWVLKTTVPPLSVAPAVRAAIQEVDPNQPVHEVMTLGEVVARSYGLWRFMGTVFWAFAGIALALGAIGIYGLTSHATAERTREVGIRMALGARQSQVLGQVMRQGGRRILIGTGIGLLGGWGIGRILSSVLFKVSAFDPPVYFAVVGVLMTVSLVAIFLPARHAASIDPIEALRRE